MKSLPARRVLAAVLGFTALTTALVAGAPSAGAAPKPKPPAAPVNLQLLAINDFHGQLEPSTSSSGSVLPGYGNERFGGAEYLATQIKQLEAASKEPNTLTVAAGDLIGASPLISAAFHDEPTIEAMNAIGLDYASVGNHEFDEGKNELLRMQYGGCHPDDGCADRSRPFQGADFQYLSANAFLTRSKLPVLPPFAVKNVEGVKVGFIGMTLEGTPGVVTPSGVAGLGFSDEAATANKYAKVLRARGVQTIVVLLHEGGSQTAPTDVDGCNALTGPITQIVPQMDPAIDVVVTGHTHQAYNCREVDGAFVPSSSTTKGTLVTSASSIGKLVTDIDLTLDRKTGDVLTATADNVPVVKTVAKDPAQTAIINRYNTIIAPVRDRQVGVAAQPITTARPTLFDKVFGESAMGDLIADAQLAATRSTTGAVAALMNPGGVRSSIDPAGEITYGEAFAVQPFGNYLATITLTDQQLQCVLEQQFAVGGDNRNVLQPAGITYDVSVSGTSSTVEQPCSGSRVPDASVAIGGKSAVSDGIASYRVTVNNFLADGGDGFTILAQGTERVNLTTPEDDLAAFTDYLTANNPTSPPATGRITVVP